MKQRYLVFTFFLLLLTIPLIAQESDQLVSVLENIKTELQEVQGKSNIYGQSIIWEEDNPVKCEIISTVINKKGKEVEHRYLLNLRNIDKNTIRTKNEKDVMKLSLIMDSRQKLIRYFKQGEQNNYKDKLELYAIDADNARELESLFENAVAEAQEIKPKDLPETFEKQINWLMENVKGVEIGETVYDQSLSQDEEIATLLAYNLTKQGKKAKEEKHLFNLADLKENQVRLKVKGKTVSVEMPTNRKLKFVQQSVDGKVEKYLNKLAFYVEEPDLGKQLVDVLKRLIPQSEEMEKERLPQINSLEDGMKMLGETISDLDLSGKKEEQSIEAACVCNFNRNTTTEKGKSTAQRWLFNLADFNEQRTEIKVSKDHIAIELTTDKSKLVQVFKDDEQQSFSKEVKILAKDVENAKQLMNILPKLIQMCQEKAENQEWVAKGSDAEWLQSQLPTIEGLRQNIEMIEADACKWKFSSAKAGKKGETEEIYEFNLYDLNPKSVDFSISGKKLAIELGTKYQEKNIKYYKNGEPGDYKNKLRIQMDNVEKARQMIALWKRNIKVCSEK